MPDLIGLEHFRTAENCVQHMQKNNALADIISILGIDELSEDDKNVVYRSKKMEKFFSQPFVVAEVFTNMKGKFVGLKDTIKSFKAIMDGGLDDILQKSANLAAEAERLRQRAIEAEKRK